MKNLITTATLWILISMSILNAQYKYDTLHVMEQSITIAQVIAPKIQDAKEDGSWKVLIEQFQTQMQTVKAQVPEYSQYKIDFVRAQKLTVEDDQSTEKVLQYNIQSGSVVPIAQISKAILVDERIEVRLFFTDIDDMYSKNYIGIIESAFDKMKVRPKLIQGLKDLYFPRDLNYFNNSTSQFEKGPSMFGKPKVAGFFDGTVGIHRNDFIFSMNYGLGVVFGRKKEQGIYAAMSILYQYDEELGGVSETLFGAVYRLNTYSSIGVFSQPNQFEGNFLGIKNRMSFTFYPRKGGKFTVNLNRSHSDDVYLGFEYGIPLGFGYEKK